MTLPAGYCQQVHVPDKYTLRYSPERLPILPSILINHNSNH